MITRYKIMQGTTEIMDLHARQAFTLDGVDYPGDWMFRVGTVPGYTVDIYDATPPPPPLPEPRASGAQMIDEAEARGKLGTLLAVLTESERAVFYTRRRIIAGGGIAEMLRVRLSISEVAMAGFIAAASTRTES